MLQILHSDANPNKSALYYPLIVHLLQVLYSSPCWIDILRKLLNVCAGMPIMVPPAKLFDRYLSVRR